MINNELLIHYNIVEIENLVNKHRSEKNDENSTLNWCGTISYPLNSFPLSSWGGSWSLEMSRFDGKSIKRYPEDVRSDGRTFGEKEYITDEPTIFERWE